MWHLHSDSLAFAMNGVASCWLSPFELVVIRRWFMRYSPLRAHLTRLPGSDSRVFELRARNDAVACLRYEILMVYRTMRVWSIIANAVTLRLKRLMMKITEVNCEIEGSSATHFQPIINAFLKLTVPLRKTWSDQSGMGLGPQAHHVYALTLTEMLLDSTDGTGTVNEQYPSGGGMGP